MQKTANFKLQNPSFTGAAKRGTAFAQGIGAATSQGLRPGV
jgi:hypothetical protein